MFGKLEKIIVDNCSYLERLKVGILENYEFIKTNEDKTLIYDIIYNVRKRLPNLLEFSLEWFIIYNYWH
jgi:hypothetical protein